MIKRNKALLSLVLAAALAVSISACSSSKDVTTGTKDAISSELEANQASPDKNKVLPSDNKATSNETQNSSGNTLNSPGETQSTSDKNTSLSHITNEEESKASPELTTAELKLYNEFVKNCDTSLLKDINPVTIYKMFFKALNSDDFKAQYALYARDGDAPAPASYEQFVKKLQEDENYNSSLKDMLKSFNGNFFTLEVKYYDKIRATLEINYENGWEMSFGLFKSSDGVWKVLWAPVTT